MSGISARSINMQEVVDRRDMQTMFDNIANGSLEVYIREGVRQSSKEKETQSMGSQETFDVPETVLRQQAQRLLCTGAADGSLKRYLEAPKAEGVKDTKKGCVVIGKAVWQIREASPMHYKPDKVTWTDFPRT